MFQVLHIVDQIAASVDLAPDKVRSAVAVVLSLLAAQGHPQKVADLFAKTHGSAELAAEGTAGGGLHTQMAGGMMGGPLAALSKLQAIGISHSASRTIYAAVFDHLKRSAGDKLLREAAGNIPGLSGYL
jgi:hypothetical protein